MIHVATVHWRSDQWIDPQLHYLGRHLDEPFQMYGWLDGAEMVAKHAEKFHYWSDVDITAHETKLTKLGDVMADGAPDDDVLVFIDGDAFPIAPLGAYIREKLAEVPLIAVRRSENNGDPQPHPSFCFTTAKLWRELPGDWSRGTTWTNPQGKEVTDVGGNLRKLLDDSGTPWHPMLRSNVRNPHPLSFGVYEDLVYHHGGGFRAGAGGRVMMADVEARLRGTRRVQLAGKLPRKGPLGWVRRRVHPIANHRRKLINELAEINEQVFELIKRDDDFYRPLIDESADGELLRIVAPLAARTQS